MKRWLTGLLALALFLNCLGGMVWAEACTHDTGKRVWALDEYTHQIVWSCCKAAYSEPEEHNFVGNSETCWECGYVCQHSSTSEATCVAGQTCDICGKVLSGKNYDNHPDVGDVDYFPMDDGENHLLTYVCCGKAIEAPEPHLWEDNVCTVCGAYNVSACQHPSISEATCVAGQTCDICGIVLSEKNYANHPDVGDVDYFPMDDGENHFLAYCCCGSAVGEPEPHWWSNGVCGLCGARCTHSWIAGESSDLHACEICGKEYPHTEETLPAKTATCTEAGLTEGTKCSVCNTVLVEQQTIPAAHRYVDNVCTLCGTIGGTCGENLTWVLTDDGTLTISGTGAMENYSLNVSAPWYSCQNDITCVVIDKGVTTIGVGAFNNCSSLGSITLPESVTTIGVGAFYGCSSLETIFIPDGVTEIGESAFASCDSLASISVALGNSAYHSTGNCLIHTEAKTLVSGCKTSTIPADGSVTTIGVSAFSGCSGLSSITIPKGITNIHAFAFYKCSSLSSITIPEGITTIGERAFSGCSALESVILPEGVTTIDMGAFYECSALKSITLPEGLTTIGEEAFSYCSSLSSITFTGDAPSISFYAFLNVSATAYYPVENVSWTADKRQNYGGAITWKPYSATGMPVSGTCGENLTWVLTDDGTLTISGTGAMENYSWEVNAPWNPYMEDIFRVVIEDGVTTVGDHAFYGCKNLYNIILPEGVSTVGEEAFGGCIALESITLPQSLTVIGRSAFFACSSLSSITIPEGVTSIPGDAFFDCSSLESVILPKGVTTIGMDAFTDCHSLTSINFPEGLTSIGNSAFSGCSSLSSITIPAGVTTVGDYAFLCCEGMESITLPASLSQIGRGAFSNCDSLVSITVAPENPVYHSNGNCVIDTETRTLVVGCKASTISADGSVTAIGSYAFYRCSGLTGISIPEGVTAIGEYAFKECGSLESVTISSSVSEIGACAFASCDSLASISVAPENPVYHSTGNCVIDTAAKTLVVGCKTSTIPADGSVTAIGDWAFFECRRLESTTLPEGITSIGDSAFCYCYALKSITIPEGVTTIGEDAFLGCSSLSSITLPESITTIGDSAFLGCYSLSRITFTGDAPSIDEYAFRYDTITAYYPAGNATWTADVMQGYDGNITWKPTCADHTWGEWEEVTPASCVPGKDMRSCSVCGIPEYREIAARENHNYRDATYEAPKTCKVCGATAGDPLIRPVEMESSGNFEVVLPENSEITQEAAKETADGLIASASQTRQPENTGMDANTAVIEAAKAQVQNEQGEAVTGSTYETSLHIAVGNVEVNSEGGKAVVVKITYDVTPYLYARSEDGEVLGKAELNNFDSEIIFHLPVDKNTRAAEAEVKHEGESMGIFPIQTDENGNKYVEVKSKTFSRYTVELQYAAGVTVSGTVTSFGSATEDVTVQLMKGGETEPAYTVTVQGNSASFTIENVEAGTYTMVVSKKNHVTREYTVTVGSENVTRDAKIHLLGDVNGNGRIQSNDLTMVYAHVSGTALITDSYILACADVNGNGRIQSNDITRILGHVSGGNPLW